jgi:hypothetical protein
MEELTQLLAIPRDAREASWQKQFLAAVPTAPLFSRDPQVLIGPDGFPYFALYSDPGEGSGETQNIQGLLPNVLLRNGLGVAINPSPQGVDWVFYYGDLVSWSLYQSFYMPVPPRLGDSDDDDMGSLLIDNPAENFLPLKAREVIRTFLKEKGIAHPAIFTLTQTTDQDILRSLVFNIFESDMESPEAFNNLMQQLTWFLPKHYFISRVPKDPSWMTYFYDL